MLSSSFLQRNYEAAIRSIPDGSTVIFNFGEIDCREGLIVAVEKGRYESVEAGVQLAVDVYVKAMQEQVAVKELKIYVHPITPGQTRTHRETRTHAASGRSRA